MAKAAGWYVLLDAAALAPTWGLDIGELGESTPDFVSLSFYKIFGYPTGIGSLVAKKESLKELDKPWFAGGTIQIVMDPRQHKPDFVMHEKHLAAHWEDGTINFQHTLAVRWGSSLLRKSGLVVW
jgi:selenocysteine lyase/cysteine desulfurase